MDDAEVIVPPRCKRCGHEPCPGCKDWCDCLDCPCADLMVCDFDDSELKRWISSLPDFR